MGLSLVLDLPRAPFGSSVLSFLAMILLVAGVGLVAIVLTCGGCPGGGGSPEGLRVLRRASRLVEWNSFVAVSCSARWLLVPLPVMLHLAVPVVLGRVQLGLERSCWGGGDVFRELEAFEW